MFGGNAKTHFQVLGRPSTTTGYMMSPFGDERWDLDDKEKLKKIYRNQGVIDKMEHNDRGEYYSKNNFRNQQNPDYRYVRSSQQPLKQRHHGYVHQSQTAQGYMPKSEITQNYMSPQSYSPQPCFHQSPRIQTQTVHNCDQRPRFETVVSCLTHSSDHSVYKPAPVNDCCAPFEDDSEGIARRTNVINNDKYTSRSQPQVSDYCNCCTSWQPNKTSDADYSQKGWSSPVWVPGTVTPYRPFGPKEQTPSPYFPVPEGTLYLPLR